MTLFGQDGFTLDDCLAVFLLKDAQDDCIVLFGIFCPVHFDAVFCSISLKIFQIGIQISEDIVFDFRSKFAQLFPFRDRMADFIPLIPDKPQGLIMPF